MKREQLILQGMSDTQLGHAAKLIKKEITRRSSAPPARARQGTRRTAGSRRSNSVQA